MLLCYLFDHYEQVGGSLRNLRDARRVQTTRAAQETALVRMCHTAPGRTRGDDFRLLAEEERELCTHYNDEDPFSYGQYRAASRIKRISAAVELMLAELCKEKR
jgi:hypothetical protein